MTTRSRLKAGIDRFLHFDTRPLVIGFPIVAAILIFGLLFWLSIGPTEGAEKFPIIWFIWMAAILGSLVNQTSRKDQLITPHSSWQVTSYIAWKCVVSAVLAMALYFRFIAGLVTGDIFPKFVNTALPYSENMAMQGFATKVDPASFADVAKILVWSFVAGYSERFVPNLITTLTKKDS